MAFDPGAFNVSAFSRMERNDGLCSGTVQAATAPPIGIFDYAAAAITGVSELIVVVPPVEPGPPPEGFKNRLGTIRFGTHHRFAEQEEIYTYEG